MARPRCRASTSAAISDWLMGMMPPSATPISSRVPSSIAKLPANPDANEQQENSRVDRISRPLREPVRSEMTPIPNAASDQVSESAPEIRPTCAFDSRNSGWMNGIRKLDALRSNSTNPKLTLRSAVSAI